MPTTYPKATDHKCDLCGARMYEDEVTNVTHADHDGQPVETTSHALFCSVESCPRYLQGVDESDL
jgi:hypothetical protein